MSTLAYPLLAYYIAAIAVLCIYGLHRYWLVWLFLRRSPPESPPPRFETLPPVTVQLPMFNEQHVARRIIDAACHLKYPREQLQIQVLDDSTDETADIAGDCCRRWQEAGVHVEYRHRSHREGFKAGALAEGLASATGEYVAVFDADFDPPATFLQETIHHFTDETVGMVQTRWSHLNRDHSFFTRIQAMSLDAHFVIEQAVRARCGRWFNFNGTAGIWRRRCIDDAGGWQHDTLTEDTDLSYRAQLKGWRFRYLPASRCPAEIPPTVGALLSQQHRWNKGLVQTAIKLLPRIFRSDAPLKTKIEAWFHLTSPAPYVFILLLTLLVLPGLFMTLPLYGMTGLLAVGLGVTALGLGTLAACVFYVVAQQAQGISLWRTILHLPALMAVGIGISVINTRAVFEAIFGHQSPFVRTPKFAGHRQSASDPALRRRRGLPRGLIEIVLGLAMVWSVGLAMSRPFTLVGVPFLILFAAGFFLVGVPVLRHSLAVR